MKKIIIAFPGNHYSESAVDFIKELNKVEPILVTGVFLPVYDFSKLWLFTDTYSGQSYIPDIEDSEDEKKEENIKRFISFFTKAGIQYKIHEDTSELSVYALVEESRFADLMIVSPEKFYEYMGTDSSNPSLRDTLHRSECPVLLLPEKFNFPSSVVIAYDGSASSVFAIKQFAYLFPTFTEKESFLVYANKEETADLPKENNIRELAQVHYKNIRFVKLHDKSKEFFNEWVEGRKDSIVISGSFGRSLSSQLFKGSFISKIITKHHIPIFIAHK